MILQVLLSMHQRTLSLLFLLAILLPLAEVGCQNPNQIKVSKSVVKQAADFNINYGEVLDKAKTGDAEALIKFLNIHKYVDGVSGLEHAQTCIELIPIAGDGNFAQAASLVKPGLRALLKERLPLAQGRTEQEALRKPMQEWAPLTWATINDLPITRESATGPDDQPLQKPQEQGPPVPEPPKGALQAPATEKTSPQAPVEEKKGGG
jgi:hypothetical protein